jgi:hypothetical protein
MRDQRYRFSGAANQLLIWPENAMNTSFRA